MNTFFKKLLGLGERKNAFQKIAERQLRENKKVIESLRDYDIGKKDISTRHIERRLPHIRVAP